MKRATLLKIIPGSKCNKHTHTHTVTVKMQQLTGPGSKMNPKRKCRYKHCDCRGQHETTATVSSDTDGHWDCGTVELLDTRTVERSYSFLLAQFTVSHMAKRFTDHSASDGTWRAREMTRRIL